LFLRKINKEETKGKRRDENWAKRDKIGGEERGLGGKWKGTGDSTNNRNNINRYGEYLKHKLQNEKRDCSQEIFVKTFSSCYFFI
jgi:hypothetical protein